MSTVSIWTPHLISELTRLWGDGLSASRIGRSLKIGKNAVIGKAHRLGLPARPSPLDIEKSRDTKQLTRARRAAYLAEYPI